MNSESRAALETAQNSMKNVSDIIFLQTIKDCVKIIENNHNFCKDCMCNLSILKIIYLTKNNEEKKEEV